MTTSASGERVVRVAPRRSGERTILPGDKRCKLTAHEVEVLRLLRKNRHTTTQIAEWLGISQAQVSRISRNQSWKKYQQ